MQYITSAVKPSELVFPGFRASSSEQRVPRIYSYSAPKYEYDRLQLRYGAGKVNMIWICIRYGKCIVSVFGQDYMEVMITELGQHGLVLSIWDRAAKSWELGLIGLDWRSRARAGMRDAQIFIRWKPMKFSNAARIYED
jgi:hypothetical protein